MDLLSMRLTVAYQDKPLVLRDLRLDLKPGEVLGLVGHSGCGKSSLALAILGLVRMKGGKASGSILWNQRELLTLKEKDWRQLRGHEIAYVPQSPMSSLNPALRIGTQLTEAWKLHAQVGAPGTRGVRALDWRSLRQECRKAILSALCAVSLPDTEEFLRRHPSEVSVGQAQRVLIAMAILHNPQLLIADEPTSALDAVTQAEILALFADLNHKLGMSILLISHDLASVYALCHRIALLDAGEIVECNTPQEIFFNPAHPFTKKLIAALPTIPTAPEPAPKPKARAVQSLTAR